MKFRLYLDNNLITHALRFFKGQRTSLQNETLALAQLSAMSNIEMLISEESLAEIRKMPFDGLLKQELQDFYFKLKEGRSVVRNSQVTFDDPIATWGSPDIFYAHPFTDDDLNRVKEFFSKRGNTDEFDARYIANAMLKENDIYAFLTVDKKTMWNYREDISKEFGVKVQIPSELLDELTKGGGVF